MGYKSFNLVKQSYIYIITISIKTDLKKTGHCLETLPLDTVCCLVHVQTWNISDTPSPVWAEVSK